jgi:hypothetical protein
MSDRRSIVHLRKPKTYTRRHRGYKKKTRSVSVRSSSRRRGRAMQRPRRSHGSTFVVTSMKYNEYRPTLVTVASAATALT